ncbi:hypothetical protein DFH06DRAFT_1144827 [Mycena polygramma]|nr:hypothetical protein DFH06DRAFT_1144827 [Mycena polygramma]
MIENPCRAVVRFMPVWKPQPRIDASVLIADPYEDMPDLDEVSDSDDEVPDLISEEVFVRRSMWVNPSASLFSFNRRRFHSDQISLISIDDGYQYPLRMAMDGNFRLRRRDTSTLPPADLQRGEVYANEHFTMAKCDSNPTIWHSLVSTYDAACLHRCNCPDNHGDGEETELAWGKLKSGTPCEIYGHATNSSSADGRATIIHVKKYRSGVRTTDVRTPQWVAKCVWQCEAGKGEMSWTGPGYQRRSILVPCQDLPASANMSKCSDFLKRSVTGGDAIRRPVGPVTAAGVCRSGIGRRGGGWTERKAG